MNEFHLIGAAVIAVGMIIGAVIGAKITGWRFQKKYEKVTGELIRLHALAEKSFAKEDADLIKLLNSLNRSVEQTYRAAEAIQTQVELTKQKEEDGKEIVASSRYIYSLLDGSGDQRAKPTEDLSNDARPRARKTKQRPL